MKKLRELIISVSADTTKEFLDAVDAALTHGWSRDRRAEDAAYYTCDRRADREPARLLIARKDSETMYVSNVLAVQGDKLSCDEWNAVVVDFNERVLRSICGKFSASWQVTSDVLHVEELMSADAFRCLKEFLVAANISDGNIHPLDRERWNDFLIAVHRGGGELHAHELMRWLTEEKGWSENVAHRLAGEFESSSFTFLVDTKAFNSVDVKKWP
jgi:aspartokinase-like uncharacterized kinase